jgi:hypothetical protein
MTLSPQRDAADKLNASRRHAAALRLYKGSLESAETGLLYTCINGCHAAVAISDKDSVKKFIKLAIQMKNQDVAYFEKNIRLLLAEAQKLLPSDDFEMLTELLGAKKICVNHSSRFVFILGFPRCGTTTLAHTLLNTKNYIESLSPEGITSNLNEGEYSSSIDSWLNSFFHFPGDNGKIFLDKSTHHLLNRTYFEYLINNFPSADYIISLRSPVARSISAYRFACDQGTTQSLEFCVQKEINLLKDFSLFNVFNSHQTFIKYVNELASIGIYMPILYPSIVMNNLNWFHDISKLSNIILYNIENRAHHSVSADPYLLNTLSNLFIRSNSSKHILENNVYDNIILPEFFDLDYWT